MMPVVRKIRSASDHSGNYNRTALLGGRTPALYGVFINSVQVGHIVHGHNRWTVSTMRCGILTSKRTLREAENFAQVHFARLLPWSDLLQ